MERAEQRARGQHVRVGGLLLHRAGRLRGAHPRRQLPRTLRVLCRRLRHHRARGVLRPRVCLMECLFADASKAQRHIYKHLGLEEGRLESVDIEDRVQTKMPCEGDFTVEKDREKMELLQLLATTITGKLERGCLMQELDGSHQGVTKSPLAGSDPAGIKGAAVASSDPAPVASA